MGEIEGEREECREVGEMEGERKERREEVGDVGEELVGQNDMYKSIIHYISPAARVDICNPITGIYHNIKLIKSCPNWQGQNGVSDRTTILIITQLKYQTNSRLLSS